MVWSLMRAARRPNHRHTGNRCGRVCVQASMRTVIAITLAALAAGCGSAPAALTRPPAAAPHVTHARAVHAVMLGAGVSGGRAYARAVWWGGVPACYALAPVRVARHGTTITVDLREGSIVPHGTACIELAMRKVVRVSLGALAPGSYLVVAGGRTVRLQG